MENSIDSKKRRSRNDSEGRNFICDCGKKYFSYQALYTHKKSKHAKFTPSQVSHKEKPSAPKFILSKSQQERSQKSYSNEYELISNTVKNDDLKTCDDAFREYLCKLRKKLNDEQFATLKCSIHALRECLNRNTEKVDPNYFFSDDLYTMIEKPNLIPNVCNFFISEYLPREYPGYVRTDEVHFIFEFCLWLNKKKYTDIEIEVSD